MSIERAKKILEYNLEGSDGSVFDGYPDALKRQFLALQLAMAEALRELEEEIEYIPNLPDCYCVTCNKIFHHLGIARHRAMHRDKYEDCEIVFLRLNKVQKCVFSKWKP